MARGLPAQSLARFSAARPKRMVALWFAVIVVAVALSANLCSSAISNSDTTLRSEPDSVIADRLIDERLRPSGEADTGETVSEILVVRSSSLTVDEPAFEDKVVSLFAAISEEGARVVGGEPVVASTADYYATGDESLVSEDRRTTIGYVVLTGDVDQAIDNLPPIQEIVDRANGTDGFEVYLVGNASFGTTFNHIAEQDLLTGEGIGALVAMVILIIVFRALGAAPIPILLAVVAIIMAIFAATVIGQAQEVSFFIINMITMIGLAVGIDYSLFIIGRFREEREAGLEKMEAIAKAGATASSSVFFSGLTVVISLLGMLAVPHSIFFSLGLGAILAAVMAVIAALTLLPAILSLMGDKVNAVRIPVPGARKPDGTSGFWAAVAHAVMAHPVLGLVLSGGLLIALALPALTMKTGTAGSETLSDRHEVIRGFDILLEDFSSGLVETTDVVIDAPDINDPGVLAGIARLQDALASDDRFSPAELVVSKTGDLGLLAFPVNAPTNEEGFRAVRDLRSDYIPDAGIPADVYVGGGAAGNVDFIDISNTWFPYVLSFVLIMSFVVLMVVFRSLVVPLKAIVMNLLSVGATYGVMTLVFIHGIGTSLFGFTEVDAIDSWIPLFLFSVLFGLSMDYHVILLSRVRERFDQTGSSDEAVAFGVQSTAGMITGAAIIMVAVFLGFALAELAMFQQMGFGLAVAVVLDATVVRSVLVPASMKLLGERNWYLPGFLEWIPDVRVS